MPRQRHFKRQKTGAAEPFSGVRRLTTGPANAGTWISELAQARDLLVPATRNNEHVTEASSREDLNGTSTDDHHAVLISFDVEAYEDDQKKITEVGVSIHDPIAQGAESGAPVIRSFHFITQEYRHLINKKYVHGCPEGFAYGESTVLPLTKLSAMLKHLLSHPRADTIINSKVDDELSKEAKPMPASAQKELSPTDGTSPPPMTSCQAPPPVVVVGHALRGDIRLLASLVSLNPISVPNLRSFVDTQRLASGKKQPVSLGNLLDALKIDYDRATMHNAGNDARLTMEALLALCKDDVSVEDIRESISKATAGRPNKRERRRLEGEKPTIFRIQYEK